MFDGYIKTFACKHSTFQSKTFILLYNHHNFLGLPPFANLYLKMNVNSIVFGYFNFYTVFQQANTQTNVINRVG